MRPLSLISFLAVSSLLTAAHAIAGAPSPANSSVPPCLAVCPLGDMTFKVVARDAANNPLNGATVVLDFSSCAGVYLCPPIPSDPYVLNLTARTVRMFSNVEGWVVFPVRAGGVCPGSAMKVYANGVLLATRSVASPDQNGNGVCVSIVDADDALFAAKLGTADPTADFNCDGVVDISDQLIFGSHHSHSCDGFVDATRRSSWGSVKVHYR
jgi:hypothetical protein